MSERLIRGSVALFRRIVRLYPPDLRRRFGRDLVCTFEAQCRGALRRGGVVGAVGFAVMNCLAAGREALSARWESARSRGPGQARGPESGAWSTWGLDIRYAVRSARRNRLHAATVVVTLAIGIGMTTAIFSLVHAVLLKPLPFPEEDRLVQIVQQSGPDNRWPLSVVDFQAVADQGTPLAGFGGFIWDQVTLTGAGGVERLRVAWATEGLFAALGVRALEGRLLEPGIDSPDRDRVAVVSDEFRRRHYGGQAPVLGTALTLDGTAYTVVGVLAPGLCSMFGRTVDVWPLLRLDTPTRRGPFMIHAIGRLASGVSLPDARRELDELSRRIFPQWAAGFADEEARLTPIPLRKVVVGDIGGTLGLFLGGVALLLLIALANVASLNLVRGTTRRREMALRMSLGATRGRLLRQLLTENLFLAMIGGTLGVTVALGGLHAFMSQGPRLPRASEVGLDGAVFAFALVVTIASGLVTTLAPLLQRSTPAGDLRSGGRSGTEDRRWHRVRGGLVSFEFAMVLPLLAGAALLYTSLVRLQRVNPGFVPEPIMTAMVSLPTGSYPDQASVWNFWKTALQRLNDLPGVKAAVTSNLPPDQAAITNNFDLKDKPVRPGTTQPTVPWAMVSPEYFEVMGVSLLSGRLLSYDDDGNAPEVITVSRRWAERFYSGDNAVGKQLFGGGCTEQTCSPIEVVGVVGDVKYQGLQSPDDAAVYQSFPQFPWRDAYLVVRAEGDPMAAMTRAKDELQALDATIPVANVTAMSDRVAASVAQPRYWAILALMFAGVGATLAAVGIYGVVACFVTRQTRDLGIRMALGADRGALRRMVLRVGLTQAGIGLVIGVALTIAASRWVGALLFDVSPTNATTLIGVCSAMLLVAAVASYGPALRATRIDPVHALNAE